VTEVADKTLHATQQAEALAPPAEGKVDTASLTRSAGRGALWKIASGGWQTVVRLGASTVLARVLYPEAFGIVGMAMLAQGLIRRFGSLGMTTGIIAKKDVTEDDLSTAFWVTAGVHVVLFGVAFAASPLFAAFFRTPQETASEPPSLPGSFASRPSASSSQPSWLFRMRF